MRADFSIRMRCMTTPVEYNYSRPPSTPTYPHLQPSFHFAHSPDPDLPSPDCFQQLLDTRDMLYVQFALERVGQVGLDVFSIALG